MKWVRTKGCRILCMLVIIAVTLGCFPTKSSAAYENTMQCQVSRYSISGNLTEMNGLPTGLSGYTNNVDQTIYLNMAAGSEVRLKRIVLRIDDSLAYDTTYNGYARWVCYPISAASYGVGTHTAKWTLYDTNGYTYNISSSWRVVEKTYTVSYHANGGNGAPSSQTKYYRKNLTLSSSQPSRSGYTFLGWSTSSSASSASYAPGSSFSVDADTTLYAVWRKITYNYAIYFNANGGSGTPSSIIKNGEDASLLMGDISNIVPTRTGYTFYGWSASPYWNGKRIAYLSSAGGGTAPDGSVATMTQSGWSYADYCTYTGGSTSGRTLTLYAQWRPVNSSTAISACTVQLARSFYTYDGNLKEPDVTVKNGNTTLVKGRDYVLTYSNNRNAGTATVKILGSGNYSGEVSRTYTIDKANPELNFASKTVNKQVGDNAFTNPLTKKTDGNISFSSSNPAVASVDSNGRVTIKSAGNTVIEVSAAAAGNYKAGSSSYRLNVNSKIPTNIYNLGEETYSFPNYSDSDSSGGHCFGMAMTSSGYYIGSLNPSMIQIASSSALYRCQKSQCYLPICKFQGIQGSACNNSKVTVAGGSYYLHGIPNPKLDWKKVIDYVKDHSYDNTGKLVIGYRDLTSGHAVNFLYYKQVNGQDRIYIYDNNFPQEESYLYMDGQGNIRQASPATFDQRIYTVALRDVKKYFAEVDDHNESQIIYAREGEIRIPDVQGSPMDGSDLVMYEVPADEQSVNIIPVKNNATFSYMGNELGFGKISSDSFGELTLSKTDDDAAATGKSFDVHSTGRKKIDPCYKGHTYGAPNVVINPTCEEDGMKEYICTVCKTYSKKVILPATGHKYQKTITRANLSKSGKVISKCSICGEKHTKTIYSPKKFQVSASTFKYNGKVQKPVIKKVLDSRGKAIASSAYSVSYGNSHSKNIGTYKIVIKFKGNYVGKKTITYKIVPEKTSIAKIAAVSGGFKLTWKKQKSQTSGYQIQYAENAKFSGGRTELVTKNTTTFMTLKKLKKKNKYFVRVRTYKSVQGKKLYSEWSSYKSIQTK